MNIKSRIAKLEKFTSKGIEVIVPKAEFTGGDTEECTHAEATLPDGKSFSTKRKSSEGFSDFYHRFVSGYLEVFQQHLSNESSRVVVLEHDAYSL